MARRRIGADYGWVGPVAILAALGGLAYVAVKYLLPGPSGNSANNQGATDANAAAAKAAAAAATAAGVQPTLNANEMAGIANEVYTLGANATDGSVLGSMNNQLTQVNNIADLNGVISAFGTKQINATMSSYSMCAIVGLNCQAMGLQSFVDLIYGAFDIDGSYKQTLNGYLSSTNINYQF